MCDVYACCVFVFQQASWTASWTHSLRVQAGKCCRLRRISIEHKCGLCHFYAPVVRAGILDSSLDSFAMPSGTGEEGELAGGKTKEDLVVSNI